MSYTSPPMDSWAASAPTALRPTADRPPVVQYSGRIALRLKIWRTFQLYSIDVIWLLIEIIFIYLNLQ